MTVEFTFGAYFRLCRPQQLSSDLSLHRNVFWEFQGSGHLSAKYFQYFQMVLARREWKGLSVLGSLNRHPQTELLPPPGIVIQVLYPSTYWRVPSGKLTLPGDFEEGLMSDAPAKGPLSFFFMPIPDQGYPTHHSTISFGGAFSLLVVRWSICAISFFFGGGEVG